MLEMLATGLTTEVVMSRLGLPAAELRGDLLRVIASLGASSKLKAISIREGLVRPPHLP